MSSRSTIIEILPPSVGGSYDEKDCTIKEYPVDGRPVLARNNTLLRKFLGSVQSGGQQIGYDGEVDSLRLLGRIYTRIMTFSVVTRYALYILPVALLLSIPLIVSATAAKDLNIAGVSLMGLFVWFEVIWASLWVVKLCARALPSIFRVLAGVMSAGTRKHALLIKALEVPISIVVWVVVSWATIPVITAFDQVRVTVLDSPIPWIATLQKVFIATIPFSCVFLVEKLCIQLITVNYHRIRFSPRIQDLKHRMHLFELLYEASINLYPMFGKKFEDDDYCINGSILSSMGHTIQGLGANRRFLDGIGRVGAGVTSVFGNIVNEVTGNRVCDQQSSHQLVAWALERKEASEALARRVFFSLVDDNNSAIYQKDIKKVLGNDAEREVEEVFAALDRDNNGDVTLQEMTIMVTEMAAGRKAMAKSLHDVDQAIKALDRILLCVVMVGGALIYGTFFSQNFFTNLSLYTTSILSFSFAFAATVQEFAGSCIFLFVKHPYDVSDRIEINSVELIVEHISLLYTVFRRVDSNRSVQIPNIINSASWIENITRSQVMKEHFKLDVSAGTTFEAIEALTRELRVYVTQTESNRDFISDVQVQVVDVGDMSKIELRVNVGHKSNWSNDDVRQTRRSKFMCALLSALRKLDIDGPGGGDVALGDVNKPTYSVTVGEEEARSVRAKWVAEKAAKKIAHMGEKDKNI